MSRLRSFDKLFATTAIINPVFMAQPANADRLKDILDRGVVRVGHLVDLPPFGMTDKDQTPIGFDIDLANTIHVGCVAECSPMEENHTPI